MIDDLQALSVFESVVRHGSMSAAARELGTTPSAVSQRLRAHVVYPWYHLATWPIRRVARQVLRATPLPDAVRIEIA